ncbi:MULTISPECIES: hypothetical protein [Nocardia]|uniref:TIGR04076 family protein n=1 Tax=Nocardia implantans TaxID=3108168 RepID=A0ABU6ASJ5_9NOCA|nr:MULTISPECIES: hypothetical protein [unclassified Nocardia]MBF6190801.1 hypothetical protein [Nocardia beijingensis]MEA3528790.1 hypothetical protein [Nocardia sp. CDC192]MEB3510455.1 hypothetical protein [Nocardia sp. CDC186]
MPEQPNAVVPHGCGPACGPWITVEQCGLFTFDQQTGEVLSVKCPSMNCFGQMVTVVRGRMADHDSPMDIALGGQKCPWIGIHVVFDPTRYPDFAAQPAPPPTQPSEDGR